MPDTIYLLRSPLLTVLQGVGVPPAYGDHPSERDIPQSMNPSIQYVHVLSIWSICTLYLRSSASPFAHAGTSHSCSAGKREPLHIAHRTLVVPVVALRISDGAEALQSQVLIYLYRIAGSISLIK